MHEKTQLSFPGRRRLVSCPPPRPPPQCARGKCRGEAGPVARLLRHICECVQNAARVSAVASRPVCSKDLARARLCLPTCVSCFMPRLMCQRHPPPLEPSASRASVRAPPAATPPSPIPAPHVPPPHAPTSDDDTCALALRAAAAAAAATALTPKPSVGGCLARAHTAGGDVAERSGAGQGVAGSEDGRGAGRQGRGGLGEVEGGGGRGSSRDGSTRRGADARETAAASRGEAEANAAANGASGRSRADMVLWRGSNSTSGLGRRPPLAALCAPTVVRAHPCGRAAPCVVRLTCGRERCEWRAPTGARAAFVVWGKSNATLLSCRV